MSINQMIIFLKNIPNINSGGCAIAAISIKRFLKIHKNINCDIIFRNADEEEYLINKKSLSELNNPVSCDHAFIKLKKSYFDCEGKQYFDCEGKQNRLIQCLVMPEKLVIDAINNKNEWNSKFNRKYVSAIERKLNIDLSDIIR